MTAKYPVTIGKGREVHNGNPATGLTTCGRAYTDLAGDGSRYTENTVQITCANCRKHTQRANEMTTETKHRHSWTGPETAPTTCEHANQGLGGTRGRLHTHRTCRKCGEVNYRFIRVIE